MQDLHEKLKILAESAKYDVSCSTSGSERKNTGRIGNAVAAGICHSWSADGRCISLLKILFTNKCVYDCRYCVNRRSADVPRASFEPEELAKLTMEFYRRNYIEGLFLSSAVEVSPNYTAERILKALLILRREYGFAGYIHAKIIPGADPRLVELIGFEADRLSINIELPTEKSLTLLAPQKTPRAIFTPMKQITNTLIERNALKGPGTMFKGLNLNNEANYLSDKTNDYLLPADTDAIGKDLRKRTARGKEYFAPAGQTTQMIIGASDECDLQIMKTSEHLYRTFKMKRVYFSAYIPVGNSPLLPDASVAPPLAREHRLYQADWLLRFYGFTADEMFDEKHPFLDPQLDPKVTWALRNIHRFPLEINQASYEELLKTPGIGATSALRIVRQRKVAAVKYEDLRKMGVVLKRAKYFITCAGKYYGRKSMVPDRIRNDLLGIGEGEQLSMFEENRAPLPAGVNPWLRTVAEKKRLPEA